jgi:hypothetical protein
MLRGKGTHEASIYYQKEPGDEFRHIGGQTITAVPSRQEYTFDQSSGFQGAQ